MKFLRNVPEISIKTRLGMEEPEEFEEILKVFNQFPVKELIIHPRTRKDQYKGSIASGVVCLCCRNKPDFPVF